MSEPYRLRLRLALVHGTSSVIVEGAVEGETLADVEVLGQARLDHVLQTLVGFWKEPAA